MRSSLVRDAEEQRQCLSRSDEENASTHHHHYFLLDNLLIIYKYLIINIYFGRKSAKGTNEKQELH